MKCCSCSKGCELHIIQEDKLNLLIRGGACHRGEAYALQQMAMEKGRITKGLYKGHVPVKNGYMSYVMVTSDTEVPMECYAIIDEALKVVLLEAPVAKGQVVYENSETLGIRIITSRGIKRRDVKG